MCGLFVSLCSPLLTNTVAGDACFTPLCDAWEGLPAPIAWPDLVTRHSVISSAQLIVCGGHRCSAGEPTGPHTIASPWSHPPCPYNLVVAVAKPTGLHRGPPRRVFWFQHQTLSGNLIKVKVITCVYDTLPRNGLRLAPSAPACILACLGHWALGAAPSSCTSFSLGCSTSAQTYHAFVLRVVDNVFFPNSHCLAADWAHIMTEEACIPMSERKKKVRRTPAEIKAHLVSSYALYPFLGCAPLTHCSLSCLGSTLGGGPPTQLRHCLLRGGQQCIWLNRPIPSRMGWKVIHRKKPQLSSPPIHP